MLRHRSYYGAIYYGVLFRTSLSLAESPPLFSIFGRWVWAGKKIKRGRNRGFILPFSFWAVKGIWEERKQKRMMTKDGRKEILRRAILKYSTSYCYLIDRWGYPAKMGAFWRPNDCPRPPRNPGESWTSYNRMGRTI